MFFSALHQTFSGVLQLILIGVAGFFLAKRNLFKEEGLHVLSKLVVEVMLPCTILYRLLAEFSFSQYPDWWKLPLLSLVISALGIVPAWFFTRKVTDAQERVQFTALNVFQNAGYLPLGLAATLLPAGQQNEFLVYLFLFLLGFNLIIWSLGMQMLTAGGKRFAFGSFFSPPVIATGVSLAFAFFGLNKLLPDELMKPVEMLGECTVPLALLVTGGNLAMMKVKSFDRKAMAGFVLGRMVLLPLAGLWLVAWLRMPYLLGLLIVMQLAMPPATSLSVIMSHSKQKDIVITPGVFIGHVASLVTIPLILSLYFMFAMIK